MLKIISIIGSCIIFTNCFSQVPKNIDSLEIVKPRTHSAIKHSKPDLNIYPNPAKNKVTLQVKEFSRGMVAVILMDIKGNIIKEDNRLLTNGTEDIVMFLMHKAGIYFIQVSQAGKVVRKKLAIL